MMLYRLHIKKDIVPKYQKELKVVDNHRESGKPYMNDIFEKRLENTLKDISTRCATIESQLSDVIRLQERVSNHENVLSRFGKRLDVHDNRIHGVELWQASQGDKKQFTDNISSVENKINNLDLKVRTIESTLENSKGKGAVIGEILKWSAAIFGALLTAKLTGMM